MPIRFAHRTASKGNDFRINLGIRILLYTVETTRIQLQSWPYTSRIYHNYLKFDVKSPVYTLRLLSTSKHIIAIMFNNLLVNLRKQTSIIYSVQIKNRSSAVIRRFSPIARTIRNHRINSKIKNQSDFLCFFFFFINFDPCSVVFRF